MQVAVLLILATLFIMGWLTISFGNSAGCAASQKRAQHEMAWADCPIQSLPDFLPIKRLTGLTLSKSLTVPELEHALKEAPVDVRVAYIFAGNVRGTWAWPQAKSPSLTIKELTTLHKTTVNDGDVWIRRNILPIIAAKHLNQFSYSGGDEIELLQRIEGSTSLRNGLRELVKEHQAWQDVQAVANNEHGFITGIQIVATSKQISRFAQLVGASHFTMHRESMFSNLRPADPPDVRQRMSPLPQNISSKELLEKAQVALQDFNY